MSTNEPNGQPKRVIVDADAAARAAKDEMTGSLVERSERIRALQSQRRQALFDECMELLRLLEPLARYDLPIRSQEDQTRRDSSLRGRGTIAPSEQHQHLILKSQQVVTDVLNQAKYKPLGFQRVRCYVQTSSTGTVRQWDVIVPEWNGDLMFDPAMTWRGSSDQGRWLGFRPATGPKDVEVISPAVRSYTTKEQIPDKAATGVKVLGLGKNRGPENYHWRVVDPRWEDHHDTDESNVELFIRRIADIREDIDAALAKQEATLNEQLGDLGGKRYLRGLGAGEEAAADSRSAAEPAGGAKPGPGKSGGRPASSGPADMELT